MKLFKFYNTKALGKNPEYCISASVLAQTEQRAREILSEDYEDERFLNEKICKLKPNDQKRVCLKYIHIYYIHIHIFKNLIISNLKISLK